MTQYPDNRRWAMPVLDAMDVLDDQEGRTASYERYQTTNDGPPRWTTTPRKSPPPEGKSCCVWSVPVKREDASIQARRPTTTSEDGDKSSAKTRPVTSEDTTSEGRGQDPVEVTRRIRGRGSVVALAARTTVRRDVAARPAIGRRLLDRRAFYWLHFDRRPAHR